MPSILLRPYIHHPSSEFDVWWTIDTVPADLALFEEFLADWSVSVVASETAWLINCTRTYASANHHRPLLPFCTQLSLNHPL